MRQTNHSDDFIIGKENIIITGMVQKKLPFLIFLKDGDGSFYVCSSFQQLKDGSYRIKTRSTGYLCANSKELRNITVNEIESVAISAWKAGQDRIRTSND